MTALLETLLGRLPIGWLQLVHNKTRLAAALAGGALALALIPVASPGVPIIAASAACLLGWRR